MRQQEAMEHVDEVAWLYIEPQRREHGDVVIRANLRGLEKLSSAICIALARQSVFAQCDVFNVDGEGYTIRVERSETPFPPPIEAQYYTPRTGEDW